MPFLYSIRNHKVFQFARQNKTNEAKKSIAENTELTNTFDTDGLNLVKIAIKNGNLELTEFILKVNPRLASHELLFLAAACGHINILNFLIFNQNISTAKTVETPSYGLKKRKLTLLMHAVAHGQLLTVKWLINIANENIYRTNDDNHNCLHIAAIYGRLDVFHWLVNNTKIQIDSYDNEGNTPFMCACLSWYRHATSIQKSLNVRSALLKEFIKDLLINEQGCITEPNNAPYQFQYRDNLLTYICKAKDYEFARWVLEKCNPRILYFGEHRDAAGCYKNGFTKCIYSKEYHVQLNDGLRGQILIPEDDKKLNNLFLNYIRSKNNGELIQSKLPLQHVLARI